MRFTCKEAGCSGHVTYIPREIDLGIAFNAVLGDGIKEEMKRARFERAVSDILDNENDFNETKAIFLNCDNSPSHTHSYQIPTK